MGKFSWQKKWACCFAKKAKKVVKKAKKVVKKAVKKSTCNKAWCAKMSKNGRCGVAFKGTWCRNSWCSKWNWCGTSALHKKTAQKKFSWNKSWQCCFGKAKKSVKKDRKENCSQEKINLQQSLVCQNEQKWKMRCCL